jgi:hypothetical protein
MTDSQAFLRDQETEKCPTLSRLVGDLPRNRKVVRAPENADPGLNLENEKQPPARLAGLAVGWVSRRSR